MLSLPSRVALLDVEHSCEVLAEIVTLDRNLAKTGVSKAWWQDTGFGNRKPREEDFGWNWAKLAGGCRVDKWAEAAAVQTPDGVIQGAMIYYLDGKSPNSGSPSVFVQHLAAAPWNRDWLIETPNYRGVGSGLLFRAVCHSWLLGFQGRVVLVALSSPRTREFYQKRLFTRISEDENGTVEFELEPAAAKKWLVDWGYIS